LNEVRNRMAKVAKSATDAQTAISDLAADDRLSKPEMAQVRTKLEAIRSAVDIVLDNS
jgi:hypothetical protein